MRKIALTFILLLALAASSYAQTLHRITIDPERPDPGDDAAITIHGQLWADNHHIINDTVYVENNGFRLVLAYHWETHPEIGRQVVLPWEDEIIWEDLQQGRYEVVAQVTNWEHEHGGVSAEFEVGARDQIEFTVQLERGWNMISFPVAFEEFYVEDIFLPLVERDLVILVKDHEGRFFIPEWRFNCILNWNNHYGLLVNVAQDCELTVAGDPVPANEPIQLEEGWSMAAYFPAEEHEAPEAFQNIGEQLLMAKDGAGRFYIPERNFNNMAPLRRGQGYLVKIREDVELRWRE